MTTEKFYIEEWINDGGTLKDYEITKDGKKYVEAREGWCGYTLSKTPEGVKTPMVFETAGEAQEVIEELRRLDKIKEHFLKCQRLSDLEDIEVSGFDFYMNDPKAEYPLHVFTNPKGLRHIIEIKNRYDEGGFSPKRAKVVLRNPRNTLNIILD